MSKNWKDHLLIVTSAIVLLSGCMTNSSRIDMSQQLTLDDIYQQKIYKSERGTYFRWLNDGSGYTVLESRDGVKSESSEEKGEEGIRGEDIVFYSPDGSERKVLVAFESLIPSGEKEPLAIEDYSWSEDGQWLLVFTKGQKVWRSNSRGDFWVLHLKKGDFFQIGGKNVEESQLMFAKFSPDSQSIGFVFKNNIYVQRLNHSEPKALTKDGSDTIVNGNFDWVYEEEFGIADGFSWSPDSQSIAFWQLNTEGSTNFTMINNTDTLYPTITQFPYPKAGQQNAAVRVGAVNIKSKKIKWAALEGDLRDRYIPRMNWSGNSEEVLIQDFNRAQNINHLRLFNVKTQALKTIMVEKDDAFFEWVYHAEWLENGDSFLWISERDGWRHIYRVSRDGKTVIDLTPGEFDIIELSAFNEKKNELFFTASPIAPEQKFLYRASLDGTGSMKRVTPDSFSGSNSYYLSKDASWAKHSHSRFGEPPTSQLINVSTHKPIKSLVTNSELKSKLSALALPKHEFFSVNARDGVKLDGYIMYPIGFDASKQYPIVFYVYGEPWGQTVKDAWEGDRYLWKALLAQKGFIVASIDNRGTKAPKGRDWRKSIYKKQGVITSRDQFDALTEMTKRWSFIDKNRVGIWGHSGGGSSTLNMLFRYPDAYHVGIASAPVPDISLYDTIYQERYSGHPKHDPESYQNASPINFASGLKGKLLLVHGTGDDNVHYQGAERLINELVKHNKQFEFMAYPNRSHSIREGEGTVLHYQTMLTNFFMEHLMNKH